MWDAPKPTKLSERYFQWGHLVKHYAELGYTQDEIGGMTIYFALVNYLNVMSVENGYSIRLSDSEKAALGYVL